MATQFVIKQNDSGGFDVFIRDLVSHGEYKHRYEHLIRMCDFTPTQAAMELSNSIAAFEKKTSTDVATRGMCERYVFDFCTPGDILLINDAYFVVNRWQKV